MGKSRRAKRKYRLTVTGQLVKHLGLQMYSGAVPAIAELISNAYDAMARNVWVDVPLDRPLDQQDDEIVVRDDGQGMSFDECNGLYLRVGLERRRDRGQWTRPYNRLKPRRVQGRKGIGKLSGFGIANRIEIRSVRSREVSHFAMDYDGITRTESFASERGYPPETLDEDGKRASDPSGTQVSLSQLKISRAIPQDQFFAGLARRLLVLDENFRVHVNGEEITRHEVPLQFRFPKAKGDWKDETLENGQEISWWAGFCRATIKDDLQRGFVVYVRGKLAQEPWFFDLSGGAHGQHGMQYLTGEIRADFLDDTVDLIATDRATVRWEDALAVPLKNWGEKKVRELLGKWAKRRTSEKLKSPRVQKYLALAEKLPAREGRVFRGVVDKICAVPQIDKDSQGRDLVDDLVEFVYNALTNRSFLEVIRQVNAAKPEDRERFDNVLAEWDIIEAVNTAHLVKGRVEIIQKFADMLEKKVREKPDMQDYVKQHPWLINPKWTMLYHERSLDTLIHEEFDIPKTRTKAGSTRVDFFCLGDGYREAHVVELKRPGDAVGRKELHQLGDYVDFLTGQLIDAPPDSEKKRTTVSGVFVCTEVRREDERIMQNYQKTGIMRVWRYKDLLTETLQMHRDFLSVVTGRASADDPRIAELDEIGGQMASLPGSRARRKKTVKRAPKRKGKK